ncbi:MAG: DUF4369 domain-containing protein, partial [Pedobacter sp.]
MNLKSIIGAMALSFVTLTAFTQSETFTIEGKVNRKLDGKFIKLYYEDAKTKKVDSAGIKKGAFKLTGTISSPT